VRRITEANHLAAPVARHGRSADQSRPLHAIDQRCDVGPVDEHHAAELDLCEPALVDRLVEEQEHEVELDIGEAVLAEEFVGPSLDPRGRVVEAQERLVGRGEELLSQAELFAEFHSRLAPSGGD
jgi:hypothetical protein